MKKNTCHHNKTKHRQHPSNKKFLTINFLCNSVIHSFDFSLKENTRQGRRRQRTRRKTSVQTSNFVKNVRIRKKFISSEGWTLWTSNKKSTMLFQSWIQVQGLKSREDIWKHIINFFFHNLWVNVCVIKLDY